jgi:iron complex transport system substrate-binding protein
VGGFVDPSIETVLTLKPHLVVVQKSPGNQKPIEKLASLGVPVLATN